MSRTVALVDAGAANTFNVTAALEALGLEVVRARRPADLLAADAIVFPGVAHFGFVAAALERSGLDDALRAALARGVPYLGICAGLQILFEGSDESPGAPGLGVLAGRVRKLQGPRSQHMGWNMVRWNGDVDPRDGWAYFAHAYAVPADAPSAAALSDYGAPFAAVCSQANVAGVQFHPERSGAYGRAVLRRFFAEAPAYAR